MEIRPPFSRQFRHLIGLCIPDAVRRSSWRERAGIRKNEDFAEDIRHTYRQPVCPKDLDEVYEEFDFTMPQSLGTRDALERTVNRLAG